MGDETGTKDGYNNDIENGASKYNKYRINYNINKNKYHIINYLIILINNFIYLIINFIYFIKIKDLKNGKCRIIIFV